MVDRDMLSAMSELLDQKFDEKLEPVYSRLGHLEGGMTIVKEKVERLEGGITFIRTVQLENNVIPRLNTIESCYVEASKRYMDKAVQIDTMSADIVVLQSVVEEHSQKFNRISG